MKKISEPVLSVFCCNSEKVFDLRGKKWEKLIADKEKAEKQLDKAINNKKKAGKKLNQALSVLYR